MTVTHVNELLTEHIDYWRIRQHAREHLASIDHLSGSVKQETRKYLKSSGNALKLQNLAYSLRHGERIRAGASSSAKERSSDSLLTEPALDTSELSLKGPKTPECTSASPPPAPAGSPLLTTFTVQGCPTSPQSSPPPSGVSPGQLVACSDTCEHDALKGSNSLAESLVHDDSAVPTKELNSPRTTPQQPEQIPEPPQLQLLRDHWQAVVVDRLMRVAARSGEPLARRARDSSELASLRAADSAMQFAGDGQCATGRDGSATGAAHRIGRAGWLEPPPLGKPPVDTAVITVPLLIRGVTAAVRGDGQVPDCEKPGDAAELDLSKPTVPKEPDVACPEIAARVPTWAQLRERFADLHPRVRHVGVDDHSNEWFAARSLAIATAAADGQKLPEVRAVLRRGAPHSQRRMLWCLALCLPHHIARADEGTGHGHQRFTQLCEAVESRQLLTDALLSHSVASLADSDDFFLFTETIRAATMAFSRDMSVAANSAIPAHPRLIGIGKGGQRHGLYPPSGVLPPTWLSSLVAPLAYVFGASEGVFYCIRALYCRYWCKLSSLSAEGGPSPCMPVLIATFRSLLNEAEPDLEAHLHSVGFSPTHCAIKWIVSGFVNVLEVEEVLLLWDRVIGFDTLLVFALAAAGIFIWRANMLRSCRGRKEAEAAVQHLAGVRAVPLLQSILFLCSGSASSALMVDMESDGDIVYAI